MEGEGSAKLAIGRFFGCRLRMTVAVVGFKTILKMFF